MTTFYERNIELLKAFRDAQERVAEVREDLARIRDVRRAFEKLVTPDEFMQYQSAFGLKEASIRRDMKEQRQLVTSGIFTGSAIERNYQLIKSIKSEYPDWQPAGWAE